MKRFQQTFQRHLLHTPIKQQSWSPLFEAFGLAFVSDARSL
jgi:hypothetical protein